MGYRAVLVEQLIFSKFSNIFFSEEKQEKQDFFFFFLLKFGNSTARTKCFREGKASHFNILKKKKENMEIQKKCSIRIIAFLEFLESDDFSKNGS